MTWQDQLRQLDEALAAGRISAEDYRRQRDELLSKAQTSSAPQAPQTGPSSGPFPEPFKWSAQPPSTPQQPTSEATQFIRPATPPGEADRTQVVPNPGPSADRTQVVPNADRTQAVSPPQQGQPWPGQPQGPQQGGWSQGPESYSPPWGGDSEFGGNQWSGGFNAQGPEVFDESGKSGKGKVIAIVAVVVVLLVAAGLYFFVFKPNNGGTASSDTPTAPATTTTTTKKKPDPFGTLIVPEGRTSGPKTYTAEQLATTKPLPTPDLVVLKQAGTTEARSVVVVDNEVTTSLWGFKSADPAALLTALETDQKRFGFAEDTTVDSDVPVYKSTQTSGSKTITVFRSHYATATEVIRVEVFAANETDAKDRFDAVLAEQLDHQAPKK
ncbi:SHOCT domain-containing protein [Actinosynnema sp. NPDC023658]|uniref:SHOCT domain-containing protein n=1 Tax=Actinosynnema sp. NPDC023658 TaxID=3155465 RepID=UPI0033D2E7A6